MIKPRILYVSRQFGHPAGGVRTAYAHVGRLRAHGFDAAIMLTTGRRDAYYDSAVPELVFQSGMALNATDILVIPEGWHEFIRSFGASSLRTMVFCQNHFYMFEGLREARRFEDLGVEKVFCGSEYMAGALHEMLGYADLPVVPYAIDPALFRPRAKQRQIAFMPRKRTEEAGFIRESFVRLFPAHAETPWVEISDMTEAETARVLGESAVFLALGRLEGLGLPPLEAMSAGCLVTGFLGNGGAEYASQRNGLWCDPEDWLGATRLLSAALDMLGTDSGDRLIQGGRETAAAYSPERMEEALIGFWADAAVA